MTTVRYASIQQTNQTTKQPTNISFLSLSLYIYILETVRSLRDEAYI